MVYHLNEGDIIINENGNCELITDVYPNTWFDEHGLVTGDYESHFIWMAEVQPLFDQGAEVLDLRCDGSPPGLWQEN